MFNRQKDDRGTADTPSVEQLLNQNGERRRVDWRRTIPRLAATLLVIAIIAAGTLWAFGVFDSGKNGEDKPGQTAQDGNWQGQEEGKSGDSGGSDAPATNGSGQPNGRPAPSNSGGGATGGTPAAPQPQGGSSSSERLADSGPAETLAVFVAATAAGITLYQVKLRRQNQN